MKKILYGLFVLSLLWGGLTFSSCSGGDSSEEEAKDNENEIDEETTSDGLTIAAVPSYALGTFSFSEMGSGWNLGNTLDAYNTSGGKKNKGLSIEASWIRGQPKTTEAMIQAVYAKGFRTIRIPVSWHNHLTDDKYTIDSAWLARVKEIVDWSMKAGFTVIINLHHDNLKSENISNTYGYTVNTDASQQEISKAYIKTIWNQVATYFKNYGDKLIFEVLNEPTNRDLENNGFNVTENLSQYNAVIKAYEKIALDEIRATGGNNSTRYVMVTPYGANPTLTDGWDLPSDSATGKLIVSVHAYEPWDFCFMDKTTDTTFETDDEGKELNELFDMLASKWTSKGIRVIMGETSATDKENTAERLKWVNYYYFKAKDAKIPVITWDNMNTWANHGDANDIVTGECHGYFDRKNLTWLFPTLVAAMINPTKPEYYTDPNQNTGGGGTGSNTEPSEWTESTAMNWDTGLTLPASFFTGAEDTTAIVFTYVDDPDVDDYVSCKFLCNGNELYAGAFTGATIDLTSTNPNNLHGISLSETPSSTGKTFSYTPSTGEWASIKTYGLKFIGNGFVVTKVILQGAQGGEEDVTDDTDLSSLSSKQFAKKFSIGWNLGNTFDAHDSSAGKTNKGLSTETSWEMPTTTQAMINAVAAKGFKTIRIPVSWHNHITADDGNYTIDTNWMARVKTVVDWAIAKNMFVILNVHHDDLTQAEMQTMYGYCVDLDATLQATSKAYLEKVWTQIATTFASYDAHLIFEALNEPRYRDGTNNGFTTPTNLSEYNAVIKDYEETCISAIRAVSGNSTRFIMVPFYAAAPYSSEGWSIPNDSATGKLLISTHAYSPYEFAMYSSSDPNHTTFTTSDANDLAWLFNTESTEAPLNKWLNDGYGVVMGEASATDKQNDSERLKWIQSYFGHAKDAGVPVVLWDNMQTYDATKPDNKSEFHGWFKRSDRTWYFPTLVEKMISIAGK